MFYHHSHRYISYNVCFPTYGKYTHFYYLYYNISILEFGFYYSYIEFVRRKSFYKDLLENLQSLDKKYLLTNTIQKPSFYDGTLLYEVLQITSKSMSDHVNTYKIRQQDYKEHIEMWVHEMKTPLAASKLIISNHENEVTKSIDEELDKLGRLVNQALFYARSSSLEKDYIITKSLLKISFMMSYVNTQKYLYIGI